MTYTASVNQFIYAPDPIGSPGSLTGDSQSRGSLILLLILIQVLSAIFIFFIFFICFLFVTKYLSRPTSQNSYSTNLNTYNTLSVPRPTPTANPFNPLSNQVKLDFNKGDFDKMQKDVERLLVYANSDEEKAIAFYWQGLANYSLKKYDEAQDGLIEAINLNTNYAAPYATLGAIALTRQDYQKMLAYSLKCISLDPSYAWCHNNLGISYLMTDQKDKGIEELRQAVKLDPSSFTFNDNLKRALQQ